MLSNDNRDNSLYLLPSRVGNDGGPTTFVKVCVALRAAALFLLIDVIRRVSENRNKQRSFLAPRPPGIVTKSCLRNVLSGFPDKSGEPSINVSISLIFANVYSMNDSDNRIEHTNSMR